MATAIPTAILSDRLHEAIGGRTVKAAVFLTFVFEPGFFEEEILPLLFDQALSHHSKLRLIQLEERLRSLGDVAVYYDRNALDTTGTPPVLDFERIPLERLSGCFHPKVVLLLLEEEDDEGKSQPSLLLAVLSANLTRRGWWESVETAVIHEIKAKQRSSLRRDLLELIRLVRRSDRTGSDHRALMRIHKFVLSRTLDEPHRTTSKVLNPRLFLGQKPLCDFLAEVIRPRGKEFNLEIVSPYFDKHEAKPLAALTEVLQPRETRIYLPTGDQGEGQCSAEFFESATAMTGAKWSQLPRAVIQRSSQSSDAEVDRFVHAKVYRLWSKTDKREILLIGSVNLTTAAHSHNRSGNFEAALLFEAPGETSYKFWLKPLDSPEDLELRADPDSEDDTDLPVAPLSLRYSWASRRAEYFWEDRATAAPVELYSGVHLGTIDPVEAQAWSPLNEATTAELARILESTSFVEVRSNGLTMGTVLVREEDMAKKRSILMSLTAEEILRYWSLLSSEQREAFLAARAAVAGLWGDSATTIQSPLKLQANSMFDQFAGIFHAFNRLEGHVVESIEDSDFREAEYRLFGKKYDSLPVLIDKVHEDKDEDPTQRYIILLTAFQLLGSLKQRFPSFFEQREKDSRELLQQLEGYKKLREHFDFATTQERAQFFEWFERSFLTPAAVPR